MNRLKKYVPAVCIVVALIAALGLGVAGGAEKGKTHWVAAWGASIQGLAPATTVFSNETVRLIARVTAPGDSVRVHLENTFGTVPLTIGAASIAYHDNGPRLIPGTVRPLTFSGSPSVTIPAGAASIAIRCPSWGARGRTSPSACSCRGMRPGRSAATTTREPLRT